jgi:hypothetical protein
VAVAVGCLVELLIRSSWGAHCAKEPWRLAVLGWCA